MNNPDNNKTSKRRLPVHFKRMGRELAMQFLFQSDVNGGENTAVILELFWEQAESSGEFPQNRIFRKAREYAEKIIHGVCEHLSTIDAEIEKHSEKWNLNRMAVVDRNVMRIAVYEMRFCLDIPPVVSIDEAVEIAKDFSSEKSSIFINGILNGIKDGLDRPAREALK